MDDKSSTEGCQLDAVTLHHTQLA